MSDYKYSYHLPPNVPPDWLNEGDDLLLRELIDEYKETNCPTVSCDVEELSRRLALEDLEALRYVAVKWEGFVPDEADVTLLEKSRGYLRRYDQYCKDAEREKDEARAEREEREAAASAARSHELALKLVESDSRKAVAVITAVSAVLVAGIGGAVAHLGGIDAAVLAIAFAVGLALGAMLGFFALKGRDGK